MSSDLKFFNALNSIPGVGAVTLRALKKNFATFENAWKAGNGALENINLQPTALRSIIWKRPSLNPDREMEKLIRENIWLITEEDSAYPEFLKEIPNPPIGLYGQGPLPLIKETTNLAVVGTRKPTAYGLETTEALVCELAGLGINIVSGLATGIDSRAHQTTLEVRGKTIAVLGSGIDQNSIFPPENKGLARRIVENNGVVLSEYAPGTPAVKEHFPQRNRIISGLARGVLVIEAREKSGALITARFALEQNREVFALPGSIFSLTSQGAHKLIQEGAKLVTKAADILEELGIEYNEGIKKKSAEMLDEKEQLLLDILSEPLTIDFIKEKTGLAIQEIVTSLSKLELQGQIRNLGGDTYQKT